TGSRSFLKNLNKQGFRLALVTGTARHEVLRMLPRNIFNLFEVVVCGCEVKNGKPHPEPYLKALRDLKMNAEDAVVIENAPFGIKSAKSAGLRCLALETSLPREFLKEADKVFNSFAHITSAVHFLRT
ncbi:MAG: HAD family phosphatase, partial [Candidatus Omnitrophica bacterium]|nr:HAD family phosphatase [Candidatus Omnitrophota bacterium]